MRSIYDTTPALDSGAGGTIWYGPRMIRRSLIEARAAAFPSTTEGIRLRADLIARLGGTS